MIALGCDSSGMEFIKRFCLYLDNVGIEFKIFTQGSKKGEDYNDAALAVANSVASKECELGVLVCGTGIGMSIMANKVKGIRAAVCNDTFSAEMTRRHNDANILCLGARVLGEELALKILIEFLKHDFDDKTNPEGRHYRRVHKILKQEENF